MRLYVPAIVCRRRAQELQIQKRERRNHETQRTCDLRARSERGGDRRRRLRPTRPQHRHRHRRHRWRLLSARRRHGQRAVQARARHAGDGPRHRRLGGQSQIDRLAAERGRAGDGRCRARCAQGRGQVQGQPGRRAHPDGALSQPHARGEHRWHRRREDVRSQGQARLHRLARQRHRGDGVSR